jgi:hypothetical protein
LHLFDILQKFQNLLFLVQLNIFASFPTNFRYSNQAEKKCSTHFWLLEVVDLMSPSTLYMFGLSTGLSPSSANFSVKHQVYKKIIKIVFCTYLIFCRNSKTFYFLFNSIFLQVFLQKEHQILTLIL